MWPQRPPARSITDAEDLLVIRFLSQRPVFSPAKWEQSPPARVRSGEIRVQKQPVAWRVLRELINAAAPASPLCLQGG